ncbi:MAG: hypothetical protein AB7O60_05940 [Variibacter sp.]
MAFGWWTLKERRLLNAGSLGQPIFLLRFTCRADPHANWQAGDVAEILPCAHFSSDPDLGADCEGFLRRHYPLVERRPVRDYSIASIPEDGTLDLVVRQIRKEDRSLGTVSGWLTKLVPCDCDVPLRIRRHANFHQPPDRPLILIGNGTGIAGLRAHLRECRRRKQRNCWLIFGERQAETDALFRDEIDAWLTDGTLARFDAAWSREGGSIRYVQHVVQQHAFAIKSWVHEGAAIMVCGSLDGMAPGVDLALRAAIGSSELDALATEGRYRRDVY